MSLPFKSELDEIKESVEKALKETEEKNDPKPAVEALKRAIERAKRKNRLEERLKFSTRLVIIEYRFNLPHEAFKDLVEAMEKYVESLKMRKDPKADEYEEALYVILALFEPDKVPDEAPDKIRDFVSSLKDYEAFLKRKHEFLDYAKAVITKTKVSELAEKGIIEKRLNEIEEELKPLVKKEEKRRFSFSFSLGDRVIVIRVREGVESIPEDLRERLKSFGIDLAIV